MILAPIVANFITKLSNLLKSQTEPSSPATCRVTKILPGWLVYGKKSMTNAKQALRAHAEPLLASCAPTSPPDFTLLQRQGFAFWCAACSFRTEPANPVLHGEFTNPRGITGRLQYVAPVDHLSTNPPAGRHLLCAQA